MLHFVICNVMMEEVNSHVTTELVFKLWCVV